MLRAHMLLLIMLGLAAVPVWGLQTEVLGDPMRPPGYVQPGISQKPRLKKGWHLSAIRIDARRRFAIINGRVLEVGAWVNKARLVEILPQEVRLKGVRGLFSVRLLKAEIRKTPVRQSVRSRLEHGKK